MTFFGFVSFLWYIEEMANLYHLTFLQHLKAPHLKARKLKGSKERNLLEQVLAVRSLYCQCAPSSQGVLLVSAALPFSFHCVNDIHINVQ
jgi:hypothetical protein